MCLFKQSVLQRLNELLESKILAEAAELKAVEVSRNTVSKSTAGDKHETSRAQMQWEVDRSRAVLTKTLRMQSDVSKLTLKTGTEIQMGTLFRTTNGYFFISVPFGKIVISGLDVYCISAISPLAQRVLGKSVGECLQFAGTEDKILACE